MTTLNFPSNPKVDDEYTFGTRTWKWNDSAWDLIGVGLPGPQGPPGPPGPQGEPAGSNGQLQFNDDGEFGASTDLFFDDLNKRLGIGTSSPTEKLHVNGNVYIENGELHMDSATKKWKITVDDSGNLTTEEIV